MHSIIKTACKITVIAILLFTFINHGAVAKEQPLFVVSNDDCNEYLNKLGDYFAAKQRKIMSIKDAQSIGSISSGNPAKEESSLFLINREKDFAGLEYFEKLFGSDISKLGEKEIYVVLKPKGGKNPNASLLISAPGPEGLAYSINFFLKKSQGSISEMAIREKFADCYGYTDYDTNAIKLEEMYFPCKIKQYTIDNVSEFIENNSEGGRIYVLNSRTYNNLQPQMRDNLNKILGDDEILPNTFLMTKKENPDNKDMFTVIIAAPNLMFLKNETSNIEFHNMKPLMMKDYPDFTTLRRVYIQDQTEGINVLPTAGEIASDVLATNLKTLGFDVVQNKKNADVIAYISMDSVTGSESWDANSERVTAVPTAPGGPPSEPSKTYRRCSLKNGCNDEPYTDAEYQAMVKKYYDDKVNYNTAINNYNNQMNYGTFVWHWEVVKTTSLHFSGALSLSDPKTNAKLYTYNFKGGDTKNDTDKSFNVSVTGGNSLPNRPDLNPNRVYVSEDMYTYELVKALGNWEKEMPLKAIMPDTSIELAPISDVDDQEIDIKSKPQGAKIIEAEDASSPSPKIVKVAGKNISINMGTNDGIKKAMIFELIVAEKVTKDPATGEVLDRKTLDRAVFKVSDVKEKSSSLFLIQAPKNMKAIKTGAKLKFLQ